MDTRTPTPADRDRTSRCHNHTRTHAFVKPGPSRIWYKKPTSARKVVIIMLIIVADLPLIDSMFAARRGTEKEGSVDNSKFYICPLLKEHEDI